jgi:hypothetical protein
MCSDCGLLCNVEVNSEDGGSKFLRNIGIDVYNTIQNTTISTSRNVGHPALAM